MGADALITTPFGFDSTAAQVVAGIDTATMQFASAGSIFPTNGRSPPSSQTGAARPAATTLARRARGEP
jgi:hypothetical protein